eukprot:6455208-Amphidinium_carterae.1
MALGMSHNFHSNCAVLGSGDGVKRALVGVTTGFWVWFLSWDCNCMFEHACLTERQALAIKGTPKHSLDFDK